VATQQEKGIPAFELREGDDRPFYDMAAQTMDRKQLHDLRVERAKAAIARVFDKPVPFFERKLREAGITTANDIKDLSDLDAIPVTIKQELRDSEAAVPPVGEYRATDLRDNVKMGTSTGTTGTPTVALWTKNDLHVDVETAARMFWSTGIRPGHIVTHAHPSYLYSGGSMNTLAYEHLGCLCIHVPPPDTDELAEQGLKMWQRITPDFPFMGFATGTFFTHAKKLDIDPLDVGLDFSKMPSMGGSGGGPLGLMTAGAECFPYLGAACANHKGSHIADDYTYVQAVGDDDRPVPNGEWGRLVVTTFGRDNFLIRYDLEEAAKLDDTDCGCGATSTRGWWGGRFKDLLSTQGRSFMLLDIERALGKVKEIKGGGIEYVVIRPTEGDTSPLRLRVEVGDGFTGEKDSVRTALVNAFSDELGLAVDPEILDRETLPRAGYKATRVVDA
jgi:phenylacetate-CoA ligase